MAHTCDFCGMSCACDWDDCGGFPQPDDCEHLSPGTACAEAAHEFGWGVEDCDSTSLLNGGYAYFDDYDGAA